MPEIVGLLRSRGEVLEKLDLDPQDVEKEWDLLVEMRGTAEHKAGFPQLAADLPPGSLHLFHNPHAGSLQEVD